MIKEFQKEYRWLSNFAPVKIILSEVIYPSVEHAYMSAKSNDPQWKLICADESKTPGDIKKLGRQVKLRDDWDTMKILVMRDCISQKFSQNPYKKLLIATGDEEIQEGNNWGDVIWGIDLKTGKGQNLLGKLIMEFRKTL